MEPVIRNREDAACVLAGAAMDIDAVAERVARRAERLRRAGHDDEYAQATRRAAVGLARVAAALRREGVLRP
jgi:F0F1-type ATP synthase epsilon subunit